MKKWMAPLLIIVLFIAGCSAPLKKPSGPIPPAKNVSQNTNTSRQQALKSLTHWEAKGRLAVTQNQKGGNASFVWYQRGDSYEIKLFGPFGSGAVSISGRAGKVVLTEKNGRQTTADSPERLLKKIAGWEVPLTGLSYWLRGLPVPGQPLQTQKLDSNGLLQQLTQQGWEIDYESYSDNNGPLPLPNRLRLKNGPLKIKMVVTAWKEN